MDSFPLVVLSTYHLGVLVIYIRRVIINSTLGNPLGGNATPLEETHGEGHNLGLKGQSFHSFP